MRGLTVFYYGDWVLSDLAKDLQRYHDQLVRLASRDRAWAESEMSLAGLQAYRSTKALGHSLWYERESLDKSWLVEAERRALATLKRCYPKRSIEKTDYLFRQGPTDVWLPREGSDVEVRDDAVVLHSLGLSLAPLEPMKLLKSEKRFALVKRDRNFWGLKTLTGA